jgi:hypothetical protein
LKKTFETLTGGNGLTAATLKEIYKSAKVDVTDDEIKSQVRGRKGKSGVIECFSDPMNFK